MSSGAMLAVMEAKKGARLAREGVWGKDGVGDTRKRDNERIGSRLRGR